MTLGFTILAHFTPTQARLLTLHDKGFDQFSGFRLGAVTGIVPKPPSSIHLRLNTGSMHEVVPTKRDIELVGATALIYPFRIGFGHDDLSYSGIKETFGE